MWQSGSVLGLRRNQRQCWQVNICHETEKQKNRPYGWIELLYFQYFVRHRLTSSGNEQLKKKRYNLKNLFPVFIKLAIRLSWQLPSLFSWFLRSTWTRGNRNNYLLFHVNSIRFGNGNWLLVNQSVFITSGNYQLCYCVFRVVYWHVIETDRHRAILWYATIR